MNNILEPILYNKALLIPAGVWCIAQVLKVLIALIRDRQLSFSHMVNMGGMPSAHTALVCSLATVVARLNGLSSSVFAVAAFFAIIVMYDATGVRQTVGAQSDILNRILDDLFKGKPAFEGRLREFIGHTRLEVIVGALLGILLAWLWT